mmetsp:Transcript_24157/g.54260  ORF Transcript_24157/g.54260 Transcript_24157/m.54260 type:complete len:81 (-) Transcript_24157:150-392(-)
MPMSDDSSGLAKLEPGKTLRTMFRPPTGDVEEGHRQGVPLLGIKNMMWHSTTDEGLGTTHGTHRANRFLPERRGSRLTGI